MIKFDINNIDRSNWKKFRFDEIAYSISERVEPGETDLVIYVGLEHLDPETIHIKRMGVPSDVEGTKLRVYKGDVIFGKRRAYQRKAAIAHFHGICSAHAMVLRANEKVIDPKLFPFFLHSDYFMHRAIDISVGSLSPTINWGTLKTQEFLLPPKEQQAELAELLWAADIMMEQYKQLHDSIQQTLECAYIEYLLKAKVKLVPLGSVTEIIMGQSPDGTTYNSTGEGIPLLNGPTEFTERYPVKIQWTTNPTKLCKEGDILLCVRGSTTGRMNISNDVYCIGRGIAAIRGGKNYITDFLEHVLTHYVVEIIRLAVGSTFPNIDSKSLKSILIPNYPIEDQKNIAEKFNSLVGERNLTAIQLNQANEIQKQLINQIFSS